MPFAEILAEKNAIVLQTKWTEKEQVRQIPGSSWNGRKSQWTVPLTWTACLQLRGIFGNALTVGENLAAWSWERFNKHIKPANAMRSALDWSGVSDDDRTVIDEATFDTATIDGVYKNLYPFQSVGSRFLTFTNKSLLSDEMGLGKTITALAALGQSEYSGLPALVITPNTVKRGWEKAAATWLPQATVYLVVGTATQRSKILAEALNDPSALVITNIEAVRILSRLAPFGSIRLARCTDCDPVSGTIDLKPSRCDVHKKDLNKIPFRSVILDEAHRIKDPTSKQTRACWAVGHMPSVENRWALTGTPIANHVGDLWSILHFLDPEEWKTKSAFVTRYALSSWNAFGGMNIVGVNPDTKEEFYKSIDPKFRRILSVQANLQLPRKTRTTVFVEMSPKQAKAYKDLKEKMVTTLASGETLSVFDHLVQSTRLMQLASSYAEVEWGPDGNPIIKLADPSSKLDALEEILDDTDKPLVIASESKQLINLAAARLRKVRKKDNEQFGLITGDQDEWERQKVITRFRAGELRAVLMTIKAGGTGVDGLQYADTMVVLQRSWSMIDNVQLEGRIRRIGDEGHETVNIIDIVTKDTIEDTELFPRLEQKFARLEEINRDRERYGDEHYGEWEESQILGNSLAVK